MKDRHDLAACWMNSSVPGDGDSMTNQTTDHEPAELPNKSTGKSV